MRILERRVAANITATECCGEPDFHNDEVNGEALFFENERRESNLEEKADTEEIESQLDTVLNNIKQEEPDEDEETTQEVPDIYVSYEELARRYHIDFDEEEDDDF